MSDGGHPAADNRAEPEAPATPTPAPPVRLREWRAFMVPSDLDKEIRRYHDQIVAAMTAAGKRPPAFYDFVLYLIRHGLQVFTTAIAAQQAEARARAEKDKAKVTETPGGIVIQPAPAGTSGQTAGEKTSAGE